jgi:hypothetical protein
MSDDQQRQDERPILKRPRPVISCLACRKKKLKCDRLLPCQQCLKGGRAQSCEYAAGQEPDLRENVQDASNTATPTPPFRFEGSANRAGPGSRQVDDLLERLRSLEQALHRQQSDSQYGSPGIHQRSRSRGSAMDVDRQEAEAEHFLPEQDSQEPLLTRFHQAYQFIQEMTTTDQNNDLRHIAAQIRAINDSTVITKPIHLPSYTNNDDVLSHMLRLLPEQRVCEKLVVLYFENFEHCARILHRPTFLEQTRSFCNNQLDKSQSYFYIPKLMGVLSIAASLNTLPECDMPTLHGRVDGVGAVQLVEIWFRNLSTREQNSVGAIQVRLLSMQSQKIRDEDPAKLWAASGQVLRQGMLAGLHKKPPSGMHGIDAQVRCWLWLTILEQDLALSIMCEMPPSCSIISAQPPLNVNDDDLDQDSHANVRVYSDKEWTDSLCQCVLVQSFTARLRAYGLHFKSEGRTSYSEVMEHARYLEQVLRELPVPFKLDQNNPPGRLMAQMEIDITLRRPLIALYAPFAEAMPTGDVYKDARIAWVQSNLVLLCFQDLFDPKYPVIDVPRPEGYWDFYYTVYKSDVIKGLQSELLELQRMKISRPSSADLRTSIGLQSHAARSHTRTLGWTVDGMTKSVEDTLDPLVRRVGREGADFKDVVLWTIVFDSLCVRDCDDLHAYVRLGLNQLIKVLRSRLIREGYNIQAKMGVSWYANESLSIQNGRSDLQWLSDFLVNNNAS